VSALIARRLLFRCSLFRSLLLVVSFVVVCCCSSLFRCRCRFVVRRSPAVRTDGVGLLTVTNATHLTFAQYDAKYVTQHVVEVVGGQSLCSFARSFTLFTTLRNHTYTHSHSHSLSPYAATAGRRRRSISSRSCAARTPATLPANKYVPKQFDLQRHIDHQIVVRYARIRWRMLKK
jgi:hypothetical protein